jgi:hypothetical protein
MLQNHPQKTPGTDTLLTEKAGTLQLRTYYPIII